MDSINNGWDNTKWTEYRIIIAVPQLRMKTREKRKQNDKKTEWISQWKTH